MQQFFLHYHTHTFSITTFILCVCESLEIERERIKVSDVCSKALVVRKWEETKKMIYEIIRLMDLKNEEIPEWHLRCFSSAV